MNHRIFTLVLALGSIGSAQGAEKIRWEEIPARIAPFGTTVKGFSVKVTTVDGTVHKGYSVTVAAAQLDVDSGDCGEDAIRRCVTETMARGQVARIEIRRGRRATDLTLDALIGAALYAGACFWGPHVGCLIMPFLAAVAAVSAPITLAVDGVELLIPPKVYEI